MDVIERTLFFKAPLQKVWEAIGTPQGLKGWFKSEVIGDWKAGEKVKLQWPSGSTTEIKLIRIEEPYVFAYEWNPGDGAPTLDELPGQQTLVTFILSEVAEGTQLHLTETGFEKVSEERRLAAMGMNNAGWDEELENVRAYVEA